MNLIKNTATNAAELYKLLGNNNTIKHPSFYPNPQLDRHGLLLNPASKTVTVYEHDGSDYTINISEITNSVNYNLN
jgi:hypothetical protein